MIGSKEKSTVDFTVPVEDPEGVYILGASPPDLPEFVPAALLLLLWLLD